jgi:predicted ester cyclase
MNKIDLVKTTYSFDNFEESNKHLSDDFQGTDSVGGPPFDKAGWIGMGQMIKNSFPDIKVVIEDIHEEGDSVMVTSYFTGTFTNEFDLSEMGMGVIPASGEMVTFPSTTTKISFDGDKISRTHDTDTGPEAGFPGLLKALGVKAAA